MDEKIADWQCKHCNKKQGCTRTTRIQQHPEILTIHIKRSTKTGNKNLSEIEFPIQLSMDKYTHSNIKSDYILYGIVQHTGTYSSGGHYYSNCFDINTS